MPTAFFRRRSLFVALVAAALLPSARAGAQSFSFNLTKRTDVMQLVPKGGSFQLSDDHLGIDHTTITHPWGIGGFKRKEGGNDNHFTLVKSGEGSEIALELTHLPTLYVPASGNASSNVGEWALTLSGHGPAFDKLRKQILDTRFSDAWKGDADLTFHGGKGN